MFVPLLLDRDADFKPNLPTFIGDSTYGSSGFETVTDDQTKETQDTPPANPGTGDPDDPNNQN